MQQQGGLNSILNNIANRNYCANRSGRVLQKKNVENLQRTDRQTSRQTDKQTNRQTNKQTDREFNYRGHSYPLWIVGGSGPITEY